ncbi:GNAT family N-acetyltransferase [Bosea sp. CS1GBMeth4]|uniref:GNAT family N-acetyltransferase n=1 Tax=Bosea sp. CS1GBMeth4 TaxID=1892849 RepID=UPI001646ED86|nr:GNAT family N-acetyltransferase [Bosea sp. CS1GBMeth4]
MSAPAVSLREITAETVRAICELEPQEAQSGFVAPNAVSIAQAYFNRAAVFRAVYADEEPVGFIMWRPGDDGASCFLWRFMIDARHQGKGYGREAIALWLSSLEPQGYGLARTSYVPGDRGPHGFYLAQGFKDTGETRANGERLMELTL